MATPKTARIKQTAARYPVPQTKAQVNDAIARIGILQRERTRIEVAMNDQLAAIKEGFAIEAQPLQDEIEGLSQGIHTWCEAHRMELLKGDAKTCGFPAGEVSWRVRPPRCVVRGVEAVIDALKRLGLSRFVRAREEINKEAVLNEPEAVRGVAGITIEQGEDFIVKPFESELEEVA